MVLKCIGFFIIIYSFWLLKLINADDESQKYKFVMDKLIKELESNEVLQTKFTFEKQESELKISGEVKQMLDLDNDWKVNLVIFHADEKNGDFIKMLSIPEKGVCDVMKSYYKLYFYQSLKNYANAPKPEQCAVLKETYVIKEYPLDTSKFQKFYQTGFYRVIVTLSKDHDEKLKYIFEGHVEEKN